MWIFHFFNLSKHALSFEEMIELNIHNELIYDAPVFNSPNDSIVVQAAYGMLDFDDIGLNISWLDDIVSLGCQYLLLHTSIHSIHHNPIWPKQVHIKGTC